MCRTETDVYITRVILLGPVFPVPNIIKITRNTVSDLKIIKIIMGLSKIDVSGPKDPLKIPSSKILVYSEKPSTCFVR